MTDWTFTLFVVSSCVKGIDMIICDTTQRSAENNRSTLCCAHRINLSRRYLDIIQSLRVTRYDEIIAKLSRVNNEIR